MDIKRIVRQSTSETGFWKRQERLGGGYCLLCAVLKSGIPVTRKNLVKFANATLEIIADEAQEFRNAKK